MSTKSANRTISVSIYALVWIVLIILQTLVTTVQGTPEMSVFTNPRLYYSTWLTDLYLVVIFYLNYFVLAPRLMRRRLFQPYLWMTLAAALIGFIIPILCYSLWGSHDAWRSRRHGTRLLPRRHRRRSSDGYRSLRPWALRMGQPRTGSPRPQGREDQVGYRA